MKHEYHLTISRTDRIWLIVFVLALLGWELIKPMLPSNQLAFVEMENRIFTDTTTESALLSARDNAQTKRWARKTYPKESSSNEDYYRNDLKVPIRIMEASWKDLRAIGFQPKVASNIEKYVAAGGFIQNVTQLLKIYGMDSLQWEAVSPYVLFPEANKVIRNPYPGKKENTTADFTIIDINKAEASDLETLPGIGTVLAERIIKYRNSLGGFISAEQIGECYGLPPETLDKILPKLHITQDPIRISINAVDLKNFNHPYLTRKMSKILEAYRMQHGPLDGVTDLRKIYPPDTTWCDKLLPYLVFE